MKAYKKLIKTGLDLGFTVSVWDGGEWQVKRSTSYKTIIDAVESVEEAELRFRDGENVTGWAMVSAFGLEDDETVIDYSVRDWIETAIA